METKNEKTIRFDETTFQLDDLKNGVNLLGKVTAKIAYDAYADVDGTPAYLELNGKLILNLVYNNSTGYKDKSIDLTPLLVNGENTLTFTCLVAKLNHKICQGAVLVKNDDDNIIDVQYNAPTENNKYFVQVGSWKIIR